MKLFIATFALLTLVAAAQEPVTPVVWANSFPVMGKTVKGVPYSADEITESKQILSDGTQISHQSKSTVYRDKEGRVRREDPGQIVISDPVSGFSYTLDPVAKTALKAIMGTLVDHRKKFFYFPRPVAAPMDPVEKAKMDLDKLKAEMAAQLEQASAKLAARGDPPPRDSLGQRVIEGVMANGTLTVETIVAGAVGNDRPFQVLTETWVSPDLQTTVMTKHTDPRTGEETFRLANIQRSEPATYLFVVPADYREITNGGEPKKEE
jgi:hypothetical protein